ncbi:glycosyltransferase family 4 protein [Cyathus striatus]|nr:glycosyltransferase family 4 protein [Cyathus striatus]
MTTSSKSLRIAFIHPDLGIGGAERLVVDAALGLQKLGHHVDIYTSHHDIRHCFEETRDGTLSVYHIKSPFPRSVKGKFHILFAHARQLHLTTHLLGFTDQKYDVYFVDQLSTCIPFLRALGQTRVVFYCHFPDKLLANGAFVEGKMVQKGSLLKRVYRYPMDWLEEATTRQADIILANSRFTARVFKAYFPSIERTPDVVYPGINISAYEADVDPSDLDIAAVVFGRPTLLSLNRFEKKKNAALAIEAFALLKATASHKPELRNMRLVLAGGYDPRVKDNVETLTLLVTLCTTNSLTYNVISPSTASSSHPQSYLIGKLTPDNPDVLFLLNFTTSQRTALLLSPHTLALLYTPANEHFGIVPVEAMGCGVPVLACDTGGPTESVVDSPPSERTGWLRTPNAQIWSSALEEIISLSDFERKEIGRRGQERARRLFGMDAMAEGLEKALRNAVNMGTVQVVGVWTLMIVGFLLAYLVGNFVFPQAPEIED